MELNRRTLMKTLWRLVFTMCLAVNLYACGSARQPLYYAGNYEELVYDMYANPGSADPATQIAQLTEDIQKARSKGLNPLPGVHLHLGYMHYLQGNADAARQEFATEKALFPESAVFVDGLLQRMTP